MDMVLMYSQRVGLQDRNAKIDSAPYWRASTPLSRAPGGGIGKSH
jgi:hypothetical protein